jgi:hypothetical protein
MAEVITHWLFPSRIQGFNPKPVYLNSDTNQQGENTKYGRNESAIVYETAQLGIAYFATQEE